MSNIILFGTLTDARVKAITDKGLRIVCRPDPVNVVRIEKWKADNRKKKVIPFPTPLEVA